MLISALAVSVQYKTEFFNRIDLCHMEIVASLASNANFPFDSFLTIYLTLSLRADKRRKIDCLSYDQQAKDGKEKNPPDALFQFVRKLH